MVLILLPKRLLCFIDAYIVPIYVLLSATALISPFLTVLSTLSSHGKTRNAASSFTTDERRNERNSTGNIASRAIQIFKKVLFDDVLWVPKRYFTHFYFYGLINLISFAVANNDRMSPSIILLSLHLTRRLYECLVVHAWNTNSKMHLAGYLLGMLHYFLIPLVFLGAPACLGDKWATISEQSIRNTGKSFMISALVFLFGTWSQYQQYRHHCLLASLRRTPPPSNMQKGEKGPRDYTTPPLELWFRHVSCPHYLAEILIYTAFAVAIDVERSTTRHQVDDDLRHWVLLLWVTTNLSVSAKRSHSWYAQNFAEYTKTKRAAIVPYLY